MIYIGIDPGMSGGIAIIDDTGFLAATLVIKGSTEHDVADWLRDYSGSESLRPQAVIESVHSMPKQGVASSFKFGRSFGFLLGCLTCLKIPYTLATPQTWQKAMKCMTKGDKNVTKAAAQRLYPDFLHVTHANADAILLARYCYELNRAAEN